MNKRLVRIISALLALLMTAGLFPVSAMAENLLYTAGMTMETMSAEGAPGSKVQVALKVTGNPGIASMKVNLSFDETLTLESVVYNEEWDGQFQPPQKLESPVTLTWFDGTKDYTVADSVFATLTFAINPNAEPGSAVKLNLTFDQEDVYNLAEENVPMTAVSGMVTVSKGYIAGDINNDGKVNNKDLTRMFQYIANWDVEVNTAVLDTNGDGKVNNKDLTRLFQYLANWDVELFPKEGSASCEHSLKKVEAKQATCTEDGNIAYWHCTLCGKYFEDENARNQIPADDVVIRSGHDFTAVSAKDPTYEADGNIAYWHCKKCEKYFRDAAGKTEITKADTVIPKLQSEEYLITYDIYGGDTYLMEQTVVNDNPASYSGNKTIRLVNLTPPAGYVFEGWYDAPKTASRFERVYEIKEGSSGIQQLYAHWSEIEYTVTYSLYQTPLKDSIDEKYKKYTVSKGLPDLPNPELYNYVFLGWYTDEGEVMDEIPVGKTGNLKLNAYWTSKRNIAKQVKELEDPIILEDRDNGVIYFTYEIGTIENIPLTDAIWTIQSLAGLEQQVSREETWEVTQEQAESVANTISQATVDSGTWTLSEEWSETTSVNETWANERGMTQEEAETLARTESGNYSLTTSAGQNKTVTNTDGTTTLTYDSKNETKGNSQELDIHLGGSYSSGKGSSLGVNAGVSAGGAEAGISGSANKNRGFTIEAGLDGKFKWESQTNTHTGTDTTKVDTTVEEDALSFNSTETVSATNTASQSKTVSKAMSEIISNTKGYGKSYTGGGSDSKTQGFSNSKSESSNTSSTVTYSTAEKTTITSIFKTDGKSEGCYRLVIAGKMHVFAVVGYDIGTRSFFTYTFNVMDDNTYEFLDYSPDLAFNDCENSALSFEIPYFVYEYVTSETARTRGLEFRTNSGDGTAVVSGYSNKEDETEKLDADVLIPSYFTSGGAVYRVTGISANAFAGKPIRSVILSSNIEEIPEGAFKDCTELEQVFGYYTRIQRNAFSGCTSLENFTIPNNVTYIGEDAFAGVPSLTVNVISAESAKAAAAEGNPDLSEDALLPVAQKLTQDLINAALNSGAESVKLNIADIVDGEGWSFAAPKMNSFNLDGGGKRTFRDIKVESKAKETALRNLKVVNKTAIPFKIASDTIALEAVSAQSDSYVLLASQMANISLIRDNKFISAAKNAVVWKSPALISTVVDGAVGTLDISGNVYCCGLMTGADCVNVYDGTVITISEADFEKYVNGTATIWLDANGGTLPLSASAVTVYYGHPYGDFPVPHRDYCDFLGWFTDAEGGTQITPDMVCESLADLKLYAHWKDGEVSDWVKADEVPEDAKIAETKYTYTQRVEITSDKNAVDGYILFDTKSVWGEYGAWSGWSTNAVAESDSRDVETRQIGKEVVTGYNMVTYNTKSTGGSRQFRDFSIKGSYSKYGCSSAYGEFHYTTTVSTAELNNARTVASGSYAKNCDYPGYNKSGNTGYIISYGGKTYVFFVASERIETQYTTEYRYRDRAMVNVYYLYKLEEKTSSTEVQPGEGISNVVQWVRYVEK